MAEIPQVTDEALMAMSEYTGGVTRKVSVAYQSWDFPALFKVTFTPDMTPDKRRELIGQVYAAAHRVVSVDIAQTAPEIEACVSQSPGSEGMWAAIKQSVGVL